MLLRNYIWPIIASVLFHGAIAVFVLAGWDWGQKPKPQINAPKYIEAKLVELKPKAKQAATAPQEVQKVDLTKRRREQELARQREAEQRAREKRAQEKRQKEAEQKRKQEERRKRELEAQRRAEREAQEKLERQRQQQQEELQKALREESGQVLEEQYATTAASYMDAIARRIEQNWSRPWSARNNMQVLLSIQLVPTGRVVNVSVVKSSGDAAFDRSAEQAVRQVEVFPEVQEMPPEVFERYYRQFNLLFNPQDLRQ